MCNMVTARQEDADLDDRLIAPEGQRRHPDAAAAGGLERGQVGGAMRAANGHLSAHLLCALPASGALAVLAGLNLLPTCGSQLMRLHLTRRA